MGNLSSNPPSLQDLIRSRQSGGFVGRTSELRLFEENLPRPISDPRRQLIYAIHGNAGTGKTFLLEQYVRLARESGYLTASVDETSYSLLGAIEALGRGFDRQGARFRKLNEALQSYRRRREEIESDPDAPSSLAQFLTHSTIRLGLGISETIPIFGAAVKAVDTTEAIAEADKLRIYLSRKLRKSADSRLVMQPVEVLTECLIEDLRWAAQSHPIIFTFDTFEQTSRFLERWILDLLAGIYGSLPANLLFVISGQRRLSINLWSAYEAVRVDVPLDVFSEDEARQVLERRGIRDDTLIQLLLEASGRLPVLLAMLAETPPTRSEDMVEASGHAVDRFLKWEHDERFKQAAIYGSLLRRINKDMLAAITSSTSPTDDFEWLRRQPFVSETKRGFVYHEVVRNAMHRVAHRISPADWMRKHESAARAYRAEMDRRGLVRKRAWRDKEWIDAAIEENYHVLCSNTSMSLHALQGLIDVLYWNPDETERWIQSIQQAGRDANSASLMAMITRLMAVSAADVTGKLTLLNIVAENRLLSNAHRSRLHAERASALEDLGRGEEALSECNKAIELDETNAYARGLRGVHLAAEGRHQEALAAFTDAINIDPEYDWVIAERGDVYAAIGRYDEAIADYTRAIEIDPEYKWALIERGRVHAAAGRNDEAIADHTRAIEIDPEYKWALIERGRVHAAAGRNDEAIADHTRAIEIGPEYKWALI